MSKIVYFCAGFLIYYLGSMANPAHQAAYFCVAELSPQKALSDLMFFHIFVIPIPNSYEFFAISMSQILSVKRGALTPTLPGLPHC